MITWTCMVCGRERPDDKIGVVKRRRVLAGGVEFGVNVRYCTDRMGCLVGAEEKAERMAEGLGK